MVFEKVRELLAKQFEADEDSITLETNISEDLGADSLDVFDLLMSVEDEFSVDVADEDIESLKTVGALVRYIEENS
ncbi:MAG: acyl carrier protein [Oscillospiraceae bacterium]|jgi:acyl carrier protein|nr:acyl carrier protein [Oscillospiraceae bacterium]